MVRLRSFSMSVLGLMGDGGMGEAWRWWRRKGTAVIDIVWVMREAEMKFGNSEALNAGTRAAAFGEEDEAVLRDFLGHFRMLAAIPRSSHHEKAVCDRLQTWAEGMGFAVSRNGVDDLIFDVPATEGMEGLPLVALQAHVDMVCVAAEGKEYNSLRDPIQLVLDEENLTLRADGTSLGADDGAGVAIIMSIAKGMMAHGPLRVIFTTAEEEDMSGVSAIEKEDMVGVKHLINVDSEASDTVTVSSAAAATIVARAKPCMVAIGEGMERLEILVSGLRGGHSGMEIGEGRCNAIKALASVLFGMDGRECVPLGLASMNGGTADNAIPSKARAVIVVEKGERGKVEAYVAWREQGLRESFAGKDDGVTLSVAEAEPVEEVFENEMKNHVIEYVMGSKDGENTMSEGKVESSCNLGKISVGAEGVEIRQMPRSSVGARMEEMAAHQRALGEKCGLTVDVTPMAKPWAVKKDSTLAAKVRKVYRELNGQDMKVVALHAGLECGAFAELSEGLDMVSIGPDVKDVHSPKETLYLGSIPKTWRLLERVLAEVE